MRVALKTRRLTLFVKKVMNLLRLQDSPEGSKYQALFGAIQEPEPQYGDFTLLKEVSLLSLVFFPLPKRIFLIHPLGCN